jgi:S-layer homology domain
MTTHRLPEKITLMLTALWLLAGCEGTSIGSALQRNLEADPQLQTSSASAPGDTTASPSPDSAPSLSTPDASIPAPANQANAPEPGEPDFIGPILSSTDPSTTTTLGENPSSPALSSASASSYSDLDQAPEELQSYLQEVVALNVLKILPPPSKPNTSANSSSPSTTTSTTANNTDPNLFRPNQAITRREFARWLLATNNRFYTDKADKKIRMAVTSSQKVFQDVATSDPDFSAIQGLAEAGIIPSPLNGSSTAVTFRPDAPLTRKDLILWKIPLDTRQALPNATVEAVQQTWGFQDTAKIEPLALKAVLADYQAGEFANIRRAFGYTTLFQPEKAVTRAEAAAVLWRFGSATEGVNAQDLQNLPN